MKPLSEAARRVAAEAAHRRVQIELTAIAELAQLNPGRLELFGVREVAGRLLAVAVVLRARTSVQTDARGAPELREETVRAEFVLERYPDAQPKVCLASPAALFLPGVAAFGPIHGEYAGVPCLFRGPWDPDRMDLPFLVRQVHAALIVEPAVLNAPADCLNQRAALHFLEHRAALPLDTPLVTPTVAHPSSSRRRRFAMEVR